MIQRTMGWAGNVARMREKKYILVLVRNPERMGLDPRRKKSDAITDLHVHDGIVCTGLIWLRIKTSDRLR
jgi:hypothetical protein